MSTGSEVKTLAYAAVAYARPMLETALTEATKVAKKTVLANTTAKGLSAIAAVATLYKIWMTGTDGFMAKVGKTVAATAIGAAALYGIFRYRAY